MNGEHADERAARRDRRRQAERERMKKHGGRTAATYRNAILKRLRKNAGAKGKVRP
jgi:hypothetical protein